MIASSTGDRVPATSVGAHCVDARLARQAGTGVGHALVYVWWENTSAHLLPVECFLPASDVKLTDAAADGVLNVTVWAHLLWVAAERAYCVGARKVRSTVMGPQSTLINVWNRQGGKKRINILCMNLLWTHFFFYIKYRTWRLQPPWLWFAYCSWLVTLAFVVVFEFIPGATASFPLTAKWPLRVNANLAVDAVVTASQTLINIWGERHPLGNKKKSPSSLLKHLRWIVQSHFVFMVNEQDSTATLATLWGCTSVQRCFGLNVSK